MEKYVAFLRAVNVGGNGKISMQQLVTICKDLGFYMPKTYIASGNILFKSEQIISQIKDNLEGKLYEFFTKPCETYIKTPDEILEIITNNPFKNAAPNRVIIYFANQLPTDILNGIKNQKSEEIMRVKDCVYIHYGDGMADSKLQLPWFKNATGRNVNTINKIYDLLQQI